MVHVGICRAVIVVTAIAIASVSFVHLFDDDDKEVSNFLKIGM